MSEGRGNGREDISSRLPLPPKAQILTEDQSQDGA